MGNKMTRNVMIIGAGGSLGYELCSKLHNSYSVSAVDRCENRLAYIQRIYKMPTYLIDIEDTDSLIEVIENNNVDLVINTAALKHVKSCEDRIEKAIDINILANLRLVKYLKKRGKEFIYISSDKAINPTNVYALSKQFTDYFVTTNKYKLVRGVNFVYSKGSVIDIWERQRLAKSPFTLVDEDCIRYFITVTQMADLVCDAMLDSSGKVEFNPHTVYRINIRHMFDAYVSIYGLFDYEINPIHLDNCEKLVEDLDFNPRILDLKSTSEIADLLRECFKHYGMVDQSI